MLAALQMSKDQLAEIANRDTPESVAITPSWPGIVAWLVGRFGPWVVVSVAFGWAATQVYADQQRQTTLLLRAFQQQTETNAEHVQAIRELTRSIDDAHRRARDSR